MRFSHDAAQIQLVSCPVVIFNCSKKVFHYGNILIFEKGDIILVLNKFKQEMLSLFSLLFTAPRFEIFRKTPG